MDTDLRVLFASPRLHSRRKPMPIDNVSKDEQDEFRVAARHACGTVCRVLQARGWVRSWPSYAASALSSKLFRALAIARL